jgi:predicted phosphodiesterase
VRRVAALYDIHCNLPALDAVLAEVGAVGVDLIVVGGDVVSGPLPVQTIDRLQGLGPHARFVMGNADREVVEAFDRSRFAEELASDDFTVRMDAFAASRIDRSRRDFLSSFEPAVVLTVEGLGSVRFCHGSPRSDTENLTPLTPPARVREVLEGIGEEIVVCGHTHRQFVVGVDGQRVVNAGSVGLPYEGRAGAYWALLGPDAELRRTEYSLPAALEEMRRGGYPDLEELLGESLLDPADPDEVSRFFEQG